MLEILIVVAVLAVLAAVAMPALQSSQTQSLEAVARIVAADLRLARSLAVRDNTEWTVEFSGASNSYELIHSGTGTSAPPPDLLAGAGDRDGRYRVELNSYGAHRNGFQGVRLAGAALKDSGTTVGDVTFGAAGGTGPGRGEDTIVWLTAGAGRETRAVRLMVSWVTGQVWIDAPQMFGAGGEEQTSR